MSLATRVLSVLLEHHDLPEELSKLIYWLLVREEEQGFYSMPYHYTYDDQSRRQRGTLTDKIIVIYTQAFDSVVSRLPEQGNTFTCELYRLAQLKLEHVYSLSRISPHGWHEHSASSLPPEIKRYEVDEYVDKHMLPLWKEFLKFKLRFGIPQKTRFEHTHVMGYSGSGKTTLIQKLILTDIQTDAGVLVMTPKGQLIPTLERLKLIEDDRLIVIRPDHPFSFNLFDLKGSYVHVLELITFILSAALGSGGVASAKQDGLLRYCTALLLRIPGANLETLSQLTRMSELTDEYLPYLNELAPSQQAFFLEDFCSVKEYGETKTALKWRINGLIENPVVRSMFCHPKTMFDLGTELDRGAVVLIDTSEATTTTDGSRFIGRFFISMLLLFAQRRDTGRNLRPVWVYIDECQSYFHDSMEEILEKSREAKVGLHLIHQHDGQLTKHSTALRESVKQNTSIKFAASKPYHFNLSIRGQEPILITTHPDVLGNLPTRTDAELHALHNANQQRYSVPKQKIVKKEPPAYDDSASEIE